MMITKKKYSILKKGIATIVVCLFTWNIIAIADPVLFSKNTLNAQLRTSQEKFKTLYAITTVCESLRRAYEEGCEIDVAEELRSFLGGRYVYSGILNSSAIKIFLPDENIWITGLNPAIESPFLEKNEDEIARRITILIRRDLVIDIVQGKTEAVDENTSDGASFSATTANPDKELLIFDLDGTLYINEDLHVAYKEALFELTEERGISRDALLDKKKRLGSLRAAAVSLGVSAADIDQNAIDKVKISDFEIKTHPKLKETLETLKAQGYPLVLATNNNRVHAMEILRELGLENGIFDMIVTASDVDVWKPDWRIYAMICQRMQYNPRRAVSVGDHEKRDINPAIKIGMSGILVTAKNLVRILEERFVSHPGDSSITIAEPGNCPRVEFLDQYLKLIGVYAQDRISELRPYTKQEIESLINERFLLLSEGLDEKDQAWKDLVAQRDHILEILHSNRNFALATRILPWIQEQLPDDGAMEVYLVRDGLYFSLAKYLMSIAGVASGSKKWDVFYYSKDQFKIVKGEDGEESSRFYHGREKIVSQGWTGESKEAFSLYAVLEDIISEAVEEAKVDGSNVDVDRMYALMQQKYADQLDASEELMVLSRNVYEDFKGRGFLTSNRIRLVDVCITGTTLLSLKLIIEYFAQKEGRDVYVDTFAVGRYLAPHNLGGFDPESLLAEQETIAALQQVYDMDVRDIIADISNNREFLARLIAAKKNMRWGNPIVWSREQNLFVATPLAEQLVVYTRLLYIVNGVIDYTRLKREIDGTGMTPYLCLETQRGNVMYGSEEPLRNGLYLVRNNDSYYRIRIACKELYKTAEGGIKGVYDFFVVKAITYGDIPEQEDYAGYVYLTFDKGRNLKRQQFYIKETGKQKYPWLEERLKQIFSMQQFFADDSLVNRRQGTKKENEKTSVQEPIVISQMRKVNKIDCILNETVARDGKPVYYVVTKSAMLKSQYPWVTEINKIKTVSNEHLVIVDDTDNLSHNQSLKKEERINRLQSKVQEILMQEEVPENVSINIAINDEIYKEAIKGDNINHMMFKGETQLEIILVTLRAYERGGEIGLNTLLELYRILKGKPYFGTLPDADDRWAFEIFARFFIFNLPKAKEVPINSMSTINNILLSFIKSA